MDSDVVDALLPHGTIGHVDRAWEDLGAIGSDRRGGSVEAFPVNIDQRQPCTFAPGLFGNRSADAAGCAPTFASIAPAAAYSSSLSA